MIVALAVLIVLGEWTGLARGLLGIPLYAAVLDVALVGLAGVAAVGAWRARRFPTIHPLDLLVGAFALLALVQVLNPNVPSLVLGLEGFRKSAFTVLAYVVVRLAATPADGWRLWTIVGLGSIPAFLWAVRQAFAPMPFDLAIISTAGASPISFHAGLAMRAFAPTAGPFHLGILSGIVLLIALVASRRSNRWYLVALLSAVALGLSITRANIGATAAAIVVMAVVQAGMRERVRMVATGVPAVVLAFAMAITATTLAAIPSTPVDGPTPSQAPGSVGGSPVPGSAPPVIQPPSLQEDRSLQFRLQFWREQLAAIAERPLLGYGTSSAADGFDADYEGTGKRYFNPHSIYTKPAIELGLVGFVLFMAILVGAAIESVRVLGRDRRLGTLMLGMLTLVAVSGLTGPMLDAFPFNVLFWAGLGLVVTRRTHPTSIETRPGATPA